MSNEGQGPRDMTAASQLNKRRLRTWAYCEYTVDLQVTVSRWVDLELVTERNQRKPILMPAI